MECASVVFQEKASAAPTTLIQLLVLGSGICAVKTPRTTTIGLSTLSKTTYTTMPRTIMNVGRISKTSDTFYIQLDLQDGAVITVWISVPHHA
jgi:hypothetical protein